MLRSKNNNKKKRIHEIQNAYGKATSSNFEIQLHLLVTCFQFF